MFWYSHLSKSFPQVVMIHMVKAFSIVSETEIDVFLKSPCFLYNPVNVGNLISSSSSFSKPNLELVRSSMSGSNCCFLTCIQISQEPGKVVWYSHLFKNFPHFVVIHTIKGFSIVNEAEVDVFLELSCFFYDPMDVGNLISSSSAFSKSSLSIWKFSYY